METIRILFYTDSANISLNKHFWGLTDLEHFIRLKIKAIANVKISVKNRHFDYQNNLPNVNGATRLTSDFLAEYDELWVFGVLQKKSTEQPHNELDAEEIAALFGWMKRGGVLITGDHSDPVGDKNCKSDHMAFINLGAAIGREIPRAGELRVWDGPPTGCYSGKLEQRDNFNTQEGNNPSALDDPLLQLDKVPQKLRLLPPNSPHRLFWWYVDPKSYEIVKIDKFPDHLHEGQLKTPTKLGSDWPAQDPSPIPVAQGRDKRFVNEERYSHVVVIYDGDAVVGSDGKPVVGRIVAHSSFHHFINRNLRHFDKRANGEPVALTDLDQMAQYFCNLALWLAPKEIRDLITWRLLFEVASHPDVLEDRANDARILGRSAQRIIEDDIGISTLYQLLAPSEHEQGIRVINDFLLILFLGRHFHPEFAAEVEYTLGCVIQEYHSFFYNNGITDPGWLEKDPTKPSLVLDGLTRAFESLPNPPSGFLSRFQEATAELARTRNYDEAQLN